MKIKLDENIPARVAEELSKPGHDVHSVLSEGLQGADDDEIWGAASEKADGNYSAYAPELPGCIATGASIEETEKEMREAIAFHLEGLRAAGLPIPMPVSQLAYVDVP